MAAQWLARFVNLFDKPETVGFELGDGNILHDHYFNQWSI